MYMADAVLTELKKAVSSYTMPAAAKDVITKSHLLVLCGVTAAGKNTITSYLLSHGGFGYIVSHTTRKPRENHGVLEQSGNDYWFVSEAEMLKLVQSDAFVEIKAIHGDTFYGTSIASIAEVIKQGKRPLTEIDVQGALELINAVPSLHPAFILPPNYEVWMERLGTRGFMSDGEKQRRMHSARMELEMALGSKAFLFVINNEVEQAAAEIRGGVDSSVAAQSERRQLAEELLEYVKQT